MNKNLKVLLWVFTILVLLVPCVSAFEQFSTTALETLVVSACSVQTEKFTVINTGNEPAFVHFSVNDDSSKYVSIEPKSAYLDAGQEVVINSFVNAPCAVQDEYEYDLFIRANANTFRFDRTLSISNPSNLVFTVADNTLESCACQTQKVHYSIQNSGLYPETYKVTSNSKYVSIAESSIFIGPLKSYDAIAYVTYPCDEKGDTEFTLTAYATSSDYEAQIPVYLNLEQCYDQSIQTFSNSYEVCPQDQTVFISVTNLGLEQNITLISSSDVASIQPSVYLDKLKSVRVPIIIDAKKIVSPSKVTISAISTKDLSMVDKITLKLQPLDDSQCYGLHLLQTQAYINKTNQTIGLTLESDGLLSATYDIAVQGANWTRLTTNNITLDPNKNTTVGLAIAPVFIENGTYELSIVATTNDYTQSLPFDIIMGTPKGSISLLLWIIVILLIILLLLLLLLLAKKKSGSRTSQLRPVIDKEVKLVVKKQSTKKERSQLRPVIDKEVKLIVTSDLTKEEKAQIRQEQKEQRQALKAIGGWLLFALLLIIIIFIVFWFVSTIDWSIKPTNETSNITTVNNVSYNVTPLNISNQTKLNSTNITSNQTNVTSNLTNGSDITATKEKTSLWSSIVNWFVSLFSSKSDNQTLPSNVSNISVNQTTNVTKPINVSNGSVTILNGSEVKVNISTNVSNGTKLNSTNITINLTSNVTNLTSNLTNNTSNVTTGTETKEKTSLWSSIINWFISLFSSKADNQTISSNVSNISINQSINVTKPVNVSNGTLNISNSSVNQTTNVTKPINLSNATLNGSGLINGSKLNVTVNVTNETTSQNQTQEPSLWQKIKNWFSYFMFTKDTSNLTNVTTVNITDNQSTNQTNNSLAAQEKIIAYEKVQAFVNSLENPNSVRYIYMLENSTQIINLSKIFSDPEGDSITFVVRKLNASNVTLKINESLLTIQPNESFIGLANFTIVATDSQNLSTTSPTMWVIVGAKKPVDSSIALPSLIIATIILLIIIILVVYFDFKLLSLAYKKESQVTKKIGKKKKS